MIYTVANALGKGLVVLFILLGVILALNTFTYLNFDPAYGFLLLKQEAVATGIYLPFFYCHIFAGGLILLAGFLQFRGSLRASRPGIHRAAGYVYVIGILFFAAPGGLVMSFFINRGPLVLLSFIAQGTLWAYFTGAALTAIRNGQVNAHRRWMVRSFALTAAAITLRIYIFAFSWKVDLNQPAAYAVLAWMSWVPNLGVAEWIIRKKITSRVSTVAA
jgi:hypothetical protein